MNTQVSFDLSGTIDNKVLKETSDFKNRTDLENVEINRNKTFDSKSNELIGNEIKTVQSFNVDCSEERNVNQLDKYLDNSE